MGGDERDASAVAPARQRGVGYLQRRHHRQQIIGHPIVTIRPDVARAAPVPAAIDEQHPVPGGPQCRQLIPPVAAVAQAAVQQDHRRSVAIGGIPNTRAVVVNITLPGSRR